VIPEVYIIKDEDGNVVATIERRSGIFSIELDDNYTLETKE